MLTLGQQAAPSFGYASLGLSLEQYGVNEVQKYVPGAVPTTAAEQQAYSCGDLTPSEVAAGQTTPTCGVVLATAAGGANAGTATGAPVSSTTNGTAAAGAAGSHSVRRRRQRRRRRLIGRRRQPLGGADGNLLHGRHRDRTRSRSRLSVWASWCSGSSVGGEP